jgi:hypothetical protein
MSQKVNAVPDSSFSVPPLTTVAGTRVSRRRIKVPCNYPGTKYSHNGQSQFPTVVTFDIADNESFLDIEKSMIVLDFTPEFHSSSDAAKKYPFSDVSFDGSSQSLMARVRIGNSQGLIIEELQAYGTWSNIMDAYGESDSQSEQHLLDVSSSKHDQYVSLKSFGGVATSQKRLRSHVTRRLFLKFKHSSFLKSCRMIPLFLMRNGIRFEIEFQNALLAMTRQISQRWVGPYFAVPTLPEQVNGFVDTALNRDNTRWFSDWYFHGQAIIIRQDSSLARDLQLRERLSESISRTMDFTNANTSIAGGSRSMVGANLKVPLKIEYTDALGVDKVLCEGVFELVERLYFIGANGQPEDLSKLLDGEANEPVNALHLVATTANLVSNGSYAVASNVSNWKQPCYVLNLKPQYEGFDGILQNVTSAGIVGNPYMPYAKGRPRIYMDLQDLNRYPGNESNSPTANFNVSAIRSNDVGNALATLTVPVSAQNRGGQPLSGNVDLMEAKWNYSCANIEMICDLVKPSSEVFLQFQQSFQAPAGIPYAYKRILYHTRVLQPTEGLQQISLPFSVRSLRGIICVISDKAAWAPTSDNTSKGFPSLSAFMKRGLYRSQLVIGGQNYPNYDLNLTELGVEQIPELECLFNVAGLGSFHPSFDISELYSSKNYSARLGTRSGVTPFDGGISLRDAKQNTDFYNGGFQEYHDTQKFVLGISTMKKDGDFVTGVDTSQAGSMSLNLFFKNEADLSNQFPGDYGAALKRDLFVQVYGIADAVFTLQNDANLVRY